MPHPRHRSAVAVAVAALTGGLLSGATAGLADSTLATSAGPMAISAIATGFDEPWAIAFLPDGGVLVTERAGRLVLLRDGKQTEVIGGPEVWEEGQGGLLDVMVPRDFAQSREVWLSYAAPLEGGGGTAVGKGRLSADGTALEGFTMLYAADALGGGRHFGSRIVEAADGTVFITTGDRGTGPDGMEAQDPARVEGKVIHLNRNGTPATSQAGWRAGLYSIGHRNAQGATLGPDGALWLVEHGAQGGDEVNRVAPGLNYGWPIITYGENYGGGQIGEGTAKPGLEQPLHYWVPSIAPSGLLLYSGDLIPAWQGDLFTGSLNSDFISRLDLEASAENGFAEERIAGPETGRVRDIVQAPDGSIWFLSVYDGAIYRMAPES